MKGNERQIDKYLFIANEGEHHYKGGVDIQVVLPINKRKRSLFLDLLQRDGKIYQPIL